MLEENALDPFAALAAQPSLRDGWRIMREGSARYVRAGVTTAQNGYAAEAHMRARLPNTHYMAAYEFFLNELVACAERLFPDPESRRPIVSAIHKLVMIDMDLTMSFYMQRLVRAGAGDHAAAHEHAQENA